MNIFAGEMRRWGLAANVKKLVAKKFKFVYAGEGAARSSFFSSVWAVMVNDEPAWVGNFFFRGDLIDKEKSCIRNLVTLNQRPSVFSRIEVLNKYHVQTST